MSRRWATIADTLILPALLMVALAVRLYKLESGLWLDEIITYVSYARMPFAQIAATYDSQNQHLFYSLLARVSLVFFGDSGWSLRLPAAIFGVASIWAAFLLARKVAGRREALLCAALLTFSYHHVWFSQNARGYTAILFWTLLSGWLLLLGLEKPTNIRIWVGYSLAAALGIYVHLTMLFVVGGHFLTYLYVLARDRRGIPRTARTLIPLAGFALAGGFVLLLYAPVLAQLGFGQASVGQVDTVESVWKSPLWTLLELVRGLQVGFAGALVAALAGFLALAGMWSYAQKNSLLLQLLIFPLVLNGVAVVGLHHHVWPRFFFFAIGFGALLLVRGIFMAGEYASRRFAFSGSSTIRVATAFAVAFVLASATSVPAAYGPKQDYGGALAYVSAEASPADRIVVAGLATMPYQKFYQLDWPEVNSPASLEAIRSGASRVWLVYTLPIHLRANYPALAATIEREFRILRQFPGTLNDGEIIVCISDPAATSFHDERGGAAAWQHAHTKEVER